MTTALVFGISGQDGFYLSEHLLALGMRVCGMVRRHSVAENQNSRITHLPVETFYGDITDGESIRRILKIVRPEFIFNLAAQSHVRVSFDEPEYTAQVNGIGVLKLLQAMLDVCPEARLYQASSSEMFGGCVDPDGYQRETTPMHPTSPYGAAKLFGYSMVRHYRRAYKLFAVNGICFNHTSPRRGANFVEAKVVKTAVQIARGEASELVLGNLDSQRDFGHSADYCRAMHLMLQQPEPDDYVIATGETRSVRDLCDYVFSRLGLDYRTYVRQDAQYMRSEELPYLRGDASKARALLGWEPTCTFESMIDEMIDHWKLSS